ncbi:uncharacterized protein wu:fj13e08 [Danio rerio]|uniref:Zinc finger protein 679 n=1 Tax=Danio rerio TaxID=7955 RepID=A0A8M1RHL4_DANRE|nr:zinc finger protein 8 [Danio rerio]|eukprot:XP_002664231.1 zinc finger protein 8 [Danio rerio]
MEQGLPSPKAASLQLMMTGCLKSENNSTFTSQTNSMEPEIEVKLEPDQDSSSLDFNEPEMFPHSPGVIKEENVDFGMQILPTGLIPPVEMEEDSEIKTNKADLSKKCTGKQKTTRKRKGSDAPSHSMRCSTEQCKTTNQIIPTKMNSDVSGEEITYVIIQENTTQNPKKPGSGKTSCKEERFMCETCGKGFQRSDLLTDHRKIHRRQKPYACEHCGMKFAKPSYLKIHLRRHAGDRPITCDQCDKRFFDTYDLKVHQRDHTGERPYICSECGKGFKRIYILNKHKLTHSKERPFQCSVCGKAYRYGYSYRLHMKEHLEEGP